MCIRDRGKVSWWLWLTQLDETLSLTQTFLEVREWRWDPWTLERDAEFFSEVLLLQVPRLLRRSDILLSDVFAIQTKYPNPVFVIFDCNYVIIKYSNVNCIFLLSRSIGLLEVCSIYTDISAFFVLPSMDWYIVLSRRFGHPLQCVYLSLGSVSYTHLDVYKRQMY